MKFSMNYDDLYAANPYKDVDYRQSWWQKTLQKLGFRTNYDAYKESLALQAKEYDAEVANKQFNEEYESPVQKAARERAAGINPDIAGIGDVAGASAPDLKDDNPPVAPEGDEGQLLSFANTVMSCVSTAFGLGSDMMSLMNMGIVNREGRINNTRKVAEFAEWLTGTYNMSPEERNTPVYDAKTGEEVSPVLAMATDLYGQYKKGIPPRYRRQFARNLISGVGSFNHLVDAYKGGNDYLDNKMSYAIMRGRGAFKYGLSDDSIMHIVKPLSELADKVQRSKAEFESNKAEFDRKLYDPDKGLNPETQAVSQNQIASNAGQSASIQKDIDSCMKDIVNGLKVNADKGDFFAKMLLLTFSLQRMTGAPGAVLKGVGNLIGM